MLREKCLFIGTSSLFLGWLLNTHVLDSNILDLEVFSLFCLLSITYILRCLKVLSLGAWFKLSLPRSPRHSRGGNGTRWQEWRRRRVTKAWRMKTSSPEQRPSRRQMNRETPFPPPRPFASAMMETRHGRTNRERMWSIFSFSLHDHITGCLKVLLLCLIETILFYHKELQKIASPFQCHIKVLLCFIQTVS